jgi:tRNA pseudouridine13 synthase
MMKSPYPLEQELGMKWYISDTPPIRGVLKSNAEDFIVDEIPFEFGNEGRHLICRLTKKNWELQRAIKEIAKSFGMSHRRISWAGTKDKRALTTQYISIYDINPSDIENFHLRDILLEVVGRSQSPIHLGQLKGNRFDILIRDCEETDLEEHVASVTEKVKIGVPNYYGLQRFGALRPVTNIVGKYLLMGDFEEAVTNYIGYTCDGETQQTLEARREFYETKDARTGLKLLPVHLTYERALLHYLIENPGDYKGSLAIIPPKLLSMFVSSYQSYLFNHTLSWRLEEGYSLTQPIPGDRILFKDGREDWVTEKNVQTAQVHIHRGKCSIALHMPGSQPIEEHSPMDEYIKKLMNLDSISHTEFKKISEIIGTRFNGASRPISLQADIQANIDGANVRLRFILPPGHYATTICREFMKTDPRKMI